MTLYCIEADVTDAYGVRMWLDIADEDGDGVAEGFDSANDWASGTIDSKIGSKYALPLVTIPRLLVQYCVDLTIFRRATTADRMTDEIRLRRDEAMEWLTAISEGKVSLGLDNPPASLVDGVFLVTNSRVITEDEWDLS